MALKPRLPLMVSGLLIARVQAFTQFQTTCTIPPSETSFVSGPDVRGTLNILWSCLFTIFACTWTIQHLNIPEQRDRRRERKDSYHPLFNYLKWQAKDFWVDAKWMVFTMIAPEIIFGKAIAELATARTFLSRLNEMAEQKEIQDEVAHWGLTHAYFVLMGGFRVIEVDERPEPVGRTISHTVEGKGEAGGSTDVSTVQTAVVPAEEPRTRILYWAELVWLRKHGHIAKIPEITDDEIRDKSKANVLVKVLAIVQVFWVCVEIILRMIRRLPISQLEVVVAAYSVSAIITYSFCFFKPKGVRTPLPPMRVRRGILPRSSTGLTGSEGMDWFLLRAIFLPRPSSSSRG